MTQKLAGTILLVVGIGLVLVTVVVERHQEKMFAGAVRTTGTVVALLPRHSSGGSTSYAPLVRFRTNDGVTFDFTATLASNPPAHKVGDLVPVVYTPVNPAQADIDSWTSRWLLTVLCAALAIVFAGLGGLAVMRNR